MPRLRTREQPPAVVTERFGDFDALEEAAEEALAREEEAVLAEGGLTVTMAEPAADLIAKRGGCRSA
ncbi:prevent-host-death protein [Streptomyces syringium]|uniref:prevent-host-death protein n=1 Tax=Streptomyces syringium TaxID=76729 RepID=UPI003657784D